METSDNSARIRELNDELRRTLDKKYGDVMLTRGVRALGHPTLDAVLEAVRSFCDFTQSNDPHKEHDCASFEYRGIRLMWKIDYYDHALKFHSLDPSDPVVTRRVLTILLANEY